MWFLKPSLASLSREPTPPLPTYRMFQSLRPEVQLLSPEGAGDCTLGLHSHHTEGNRPERRPGESSRAKLTFGSGAQSPGTQSLMLPPCFAAVAASSATPSPPPSAVWRDSGEAGVQAFTPLPEKPVRESQPETQTAPRRLDSDTQEEGARVQGRVGPATDR